MDSYEFKIKTKREDIDFINKIMEAYEGVGVVRTKNADAGDLSIVSTTDFKEDVRMIVEDLNRKWVKAEIVSEGPWSGEL
ncbi:MULTISPECIES: DUF4911 domain-containing protein [unclassified Cetobacterium]|uniref:DUF4911 domain-containing protein n=1 Tax=unclassified Cetobacterium TaxID=2630983 RepID=UPI000646844E|nr:MULTISPECIES: DUF4911 domain-containing protein [unclassified Cetobacterium]